MDPARGGVIHQAQASRQRPGLEIVPYSKVPHLLSDLMVLMDPRRDHVKGRFAAGLLEAAADGLTINCDQFAFTGASRGGKQTIVIFPIDDLGWKDVGCNGSSYY